ncbi:MAG: 50S ribosomal protein L18 [Clostridia bacterium]
MSRNEERRRRHLRVRKKVSGTAEKPRLSVFRSLKHIYGQLIDDATGHTLASASSLDPEIRETDLSGRERATRVGEVLGERALANGIDKVVFDRGGYKYHGQIKALAEGAREKGLKF